MCYAPGLYAHIHTEMVVYTEADPGFVNSGFVQKTRGGHAYF